MVDLKAPHKIMSVAVTNRVLECCRERIFGAEIRIGNDRSNGGKQNPRCGVISSIESGETLSFSCQGMVGQYVTVTIPEREENLVLCEVQVYGLPADGSGEFYIIEAEGRKHQNVQIVTFSMSSVPEDATPKDLKTPNGAPNVALQGIATQSSTNSYFGYAQNANDGSLAANYLRSQCSYTKSERDPWWMVDLKAPHKIMSVAVTNRVLECCRERIFGAEIRIGNDRSNGGKQNPRCGVISSIESGETLSFSCQGMVGQYVTVTIPEREENLVLCEVQVYGLPADGSGEFYIIEAEGRKHQNVQIVTFSMSSVPEDATPKDLKTPNGVRCPDTMIAAIMNCKDFTHSAATADTQETCSFKVHWVYCFINHVANNRKQIAFGSAFLSMLFSVLLNLSTRPSDWGWYTEVLNWEIFRALHNSLITLLMKAPNVALKGIAQQSSLYNMYGEAKNAIDGSLDSNYLFIQCAGTFEQDDPWWMVDLKSTFKVFTVAVTNRGDCCAERIKGAEIRIGNSAENGGTQNPICGVISSMGYGQTLAFECGGMEGQYVTVFIPGAERSVTICEVQVFGLPSEDTALQAAEAGPYGMVEIRQGCDILACGPEMLKHFVDVSEEDIDDGFFPLNVDFPDVWSLLLDFFDDDSQEIEVPEPEGENLAFRGITSQSSTYDKFGASENAIDGSTSTVYMSGHCSHTDMDVEPWWRVDLLSTYNITKVKIKNRGDCCQERINGAEIRIGNSREKGGNRNPRCAKIESLGLGKEEEYVCGMVGQYITVSIPGRAGYLTLCEVKVYGTNVSEGYTVPEVKTEFNSEEHDLATELRNVLKHSNAAPNVAMTATATQSSTDGEVASNAIDGNLEKCSKTSPEDQPWWTLDLGSDHKVFSVAVTSGSNSSAEHLRGAEIHVGFSATGWKKNPICGTISSIQPEETFSFNCNGLEGRYVTIVVPHKASTLSLCEVQVFALSVDTPSKLSFSPQDIYWDLSYQIRPIFLVSCPHLSARVYGLQLENGMEILRFRRIIMEGNMFRIIRSSCDYMIAFQVKNVAPQGIPAQSSYYGSRSEVGRAIDGSLSSNYMAGDCTHTRKEMSPWWNLDLKSTYRISSVAITNRGDCCRERINGAEIHIGNSAEDGGIGNPRCGVIFRMNYGETLSFNCKGMEGRYVTIVIPDQKQYLSLCEVQVFGELSETSPEVKKESTEIPPTVIRKEDSPGVPPAATDLRSRYFRFPRESNTDYVVLTPAETMRLAAFTLCMNVSLNVSDNRETILFSYRTTYYDELNLWLEMNGDLGFYMSGEGLMFPEI
ncbi:unnamed protein product [Ranitomeya imitator]|uniref:Uncharacterized protein n=1 Tax=Ranitomeya imitator TaxID=111125 RepID=A0ABN9LC38_9NEOB|nr:unnamed protein product [Ranitomeya imitator]